MSNKVFPIEVIKHIPQRFKLIEWKLHNVCTYDCSFCGQNYKDGSQRWFSLEKCKQIVDKIADACAGAPYHFIFTGGEPTVFPELIELLKYAKSKGAWIVIISNGTKSIRWWKEMVEADVLTRLVLTYHSEQTTNYQKIAEIMNLFHDTPTEVACEITHTKDTIDQAFEGFKYITENTGGSINIKAMNISHYDIYSIYKPEQLAHIRASTYEQGALAHSKTPTRIPRVFQLDSVMKVTMNDGSIQFLNHQELMKNHLNNFSGWHCNIGSNSLRIDYDVIYRSICGITGIIGRVDDEKISFTTDIVTCDRLACVCHADLIATKTNPESNWTQHAIPISTQQ